MFKVIVTGGIALASVGSLAATSSCGSDTTSTFPSDASGDAFPQEGFAPLPVAPVDSGNDASSDSSEIYDAGDADAAFPPII